MHQLLFKKFLVEQLSLQESMSQLSTDMTWPSVELRASRVQAPTGN